MAPRESSSFAELGLLTIHIACLQGDWKELLQLLVAEKDVDSRTAQGETPLMLAAMMGQIEIVVILRQHHAAIDPIDWSGMNALAYTADNAFADLRRKSYAQHGFMQTEGAQYRRIAITTLLSPMLAPPKSFTGVATGPIYFRTTSTSIETLHSLGSILTPGDPRPKTVGFIRTATDFTPRAWVVSGWSRRTTLKSGAPQPSKLLEGRRWTKATLRRVAPVIGFVFQSHVLDQGWKSGTIPLSKRGSFFASHAEVKLAVWYCFSLLAAMKSIPHPSMTFLARHLGDLATANLGDGRRAVIEINLPPCESCARFLMALTRVTKICFEPLYRRTLALVPEDIKQRNGLLAHEVDWRELDETDAGSDTDGEWDTDADADADADADDDHLADCEGWRSDVESETIPQGLEDYEIEPFRKKKHTIKKQRDPKANGNSLNLPKHHNHSSQRTTSSSNCEPNQIGAIIGTANSLELSPRVGPETPNTASPTVVHTSATGFNNRRIEEPLSPIEMMLSARNSRSKPKRGKWSKYYLKKRGQTEIRNWRREKMRIKREEADLANANIERPQTPDNSITAMSLQGGITPGPDLNEHLYTQNADANVNISPMAELSIVLDSTSMGPVTPVHISPTRITRRLPAPASAAATERIRSFTYGHGSTLPRATTQAPHSQAFFLPTGTPQTIIQSWSRLPLDRDPPDNDDEN